MTQFTPVDFRMSNIADLESFEKTPLEERNLPGSTYQLLKQSAERYGDKIAMRFLLEAKPEEEGVTYSYRQMMAQVTQTANALRQLEIQADDTVGILLPNLPQTQFSIWGGEAAAIINPINPLLEVEHIASILNETKCSLLITLAPMVGTDLWAKARALQQLVPTLKTLITVDIANFLSDELRSLVTADRENYLCDNVLDFDQLIADQPGDRLLSERQIKAEDIASYFHTGGTTGIPKLAPHSHFNEVASAFQIATVASSGSEESYTNLVGLPLFHVNAVFVSLSTWLTGGEVILATPQGYRSPAVIENFWLLVEKFQINIFSAVPTILTGLLAYPTEGYDLSSLKYAICGAAPLATELARQFEAQTGLVLLEGYGQTEGTCASTLTPRFGPRPIGTVGMRLPYLNLRIVEIDEKSGKTIRDCDVNETGVIAISGPNVFKGYRQPEQNLGQWVDEDWFNTGDLGRLDAEGYLWLTGRSKDLIIRGGHNIDPKVIEEAYFLHNAVADVAAVGKPDARVGEIPVVYVQLKAGVEVSVAELIEFGQKNISERAAVPKEVHLIESMPLTAVGKVFKPELRNDVTKKFIQSELLRMGVKYVELNVVQDKKFGQSAWIQLKSDEHKKSVIAVFGQHSFKTTVEVL